VERKEFLKSHLIEAVRAAAAEAEGKDELACHLRSATKMRLIKMSDDELWDLAVIFAILLKKPAKQIFHGFKQAVEEHEATREEWIKDL